VAGEKKKTILVAQPAGDWQDLVAMVIRRSGYQLVETHTGRKALDEAAAVIPDLILLDLGLPDVSGDQVMAELRSDPSTKHIPVVVETDDGENENVWRVIKAGAKEVLYKPFDLSDLPSILRHHLFASKTER
jgi:DNA-binding response OmpR family regulator